MPTPLPLSSAQPCDPLPALDVGLGGAPDYHPGGPVAALQSQLRIALAERPALRPTTDPAQILSRLGGVAVLAGGYAVALAWLL